MTGSESWGANVLVSVFSAPFQSFISAWLLQLAFRWVTKNPLRYWRAYGASVFGTWLAAIPSFLGAMVAEGTEAEGKMALFVLPICLAVFALFYGKYLKTPDGNSIGAKRGFLVLLAEAAIIISIALVVVVMIFVGLIPLLRGI